MGVVGTKIRRRWSHRVERVFYGKFLAQTCRTSCWLETFVLAWRTVLGGVTSSNRSCPLRSSHLLDRLPSLRQSLQGASILLEGSIIHVLEFRESSQHSVVVLVKLYPWSDIPLLFLLIFISMLLPDWIISQMSLVSFYSGHHLRFFEWATYWRLVL